MDEFIDLGSTIGFCAQEPNKLFYSSIFVDAFNLGKHDIGDVFEATVTLKVVYAEMGLEGQKRFKLEIRKMKKG